MADEEHGDGGDEDDGHVGLPRLRRGLQLALHRRLGPLPHHGRVPHRRRPLPIGRRLLSRIAAEMRGRGGAKCTPASYIISLEMTFKIVNVMNIKLSQKYSF